MCIFLNNGSTLFTESSASKGKPGTNFNLQTELQSSQEVFNEHINDKRRIYVAMRKKYFKKLELNS